MIKFYKIDVAPDKVFFTSDLHLGHKNISQDNVWDRVDTADNLRPWTVNEMDKYIIQHINDVVPYDGVLVHGGDWSFGGQDNIAKYRKQLAVDTIISATGNHDHWQKQNGWSHYGFHPVSGDIVYLNICGQLICLTHYALRTWMQQHKGVWNLYGHSHGSLKDDVQQKSLDIGFDTCLYGHQKYTLYSFDELNSIMQTKETQIIDHHK